MYQTKNVYISLDTLVLMIINAFIRILSFYLYHIFADSTVNNNSSIVENMICKFSILLTSQTCTEYEEFFFPDLPRFKATNLS